MPLDINSLNPLQGEGMHGVLSSGSHVSLVIGPFLIVMEEAVQQIQDGQMVVIQ